MGALLDPVQSRGRGRPSLYHPDYCERVIELAAQGCGRVEMAAALHVSVKTLVAWMRAHPEFHDAMTRAKDLEYAWWLAAGRKGQFLRNWNANGWALQMRNRFRKRFRDRDPIKSIAGVSEPTNTEALRDEIERKLSRLLAAADAQGFSEHADSERDRSTSV